MEARGCTAILAAALGVTALLAAGPARAGHVAVLVVPPFSPAEYAVRGAVGLLVPGAGETVSRAGALAALERGRVRSSLLGGVPGGRPLIAIGRRPREITVYVSLPPPGRHHNVHRYPIAIVGGGYRGLLVSDATRIPGLVSVADVAPAVLALERGRAPVIRSRPDADAPAELERLDRRLARAHDSRDPATIVLVTAVLLGLALAVSLRSPLAARAAVLAAPAALASSLLLSAAGTTRWWLLALLTGLGVVVLAAARRALVAALVGLFVLYLVVLAAWPETSSLASIGPHPDGGGRFYGITNQVETLLLAPAFLAGALLGLRLLLPVAALALVTVGAGKTGADGGGALVLAAGFLVLAVRLRGLPLTPRRLVLVAAGAVAVALALVGLDAAAGGSSHVTRAVGSGPGSLAGDFAHRLNVSYKGAISSWYAGLIVVGCLLVLAWFATRRPRFPSVDALLVALALSLLVNDTPTDVAGFGALECGALWAWERLDSRGMRRLAPILLGCAMLALAGCGAGKTVSPLPETVEGTVPKAAPTAKGDPEAGKKLFAAQGCGACHTFAPAGSKASLGPDLDKLAEYAQKASQGTLEEFAATSITSPDAYVEPGFSPGVMPTLPLSDQQIADLVAFMTQKP